MYVKTKPLLIAGCACELNSRSLFSKSIAEEAKLLRSEFMT